MSTLSWVLIAVTWLFTLGPFSTSTSVERLPFLYTLQREDIVKVTVEHNSNVSSWIYREDIQRWVFESMPWVVVDDTRWAGILLLLSGPRQARTLNEYADNLSEFGLSDPATVVSLGLRDGTVRNISIGISTPDGQRNYVYTSSTGSLALIDVSWSEIITRLVEQPPYPKWFYKFQPLSVRELIIFENSSIKHAYGRNTESGKWFICVLPIEKDPCDGEDPADSDRVLENLQHIANHKIIGLAALDLNTVEEFEQFGNTTNSPYIRIRLENQSPDGITEITGITLNIGNNTSDGNGVYAVISETNDVVVLDRNWTEIVINNLFTNLPLYEES